MSVYVTTYRFRNTLYHVQSYMARFGSYPDNQYEIQYAGYMNSFSPSYVMTVDEWSELDNVPPTGTSYGEISGDITGFVKTDWHTALHVVAGNGTDYAIGIATHVMEMGVQKMFGTSLYIYTSDNPGTWYTSSYIRSPRVGMLNVETAYNALPEYIYIGCNENVIPTSQFYPSPNWGCWYWYDENSEIHTTGHDEIRKLISKLYGLEQNTEQAPDPDPTPIPNDDPYAPGGSAWTGGGDGTFDETTDDVEIPNLPTLSATSTGFLTLFNPTATQLRNLANYMWSGLFDIDTFRKLFADPMDCILGLSIVPVDVPSGGSATVMVGNISTGISMTTASAQYVEVQCGSVSVEEFWGSYLDYDPFTEFQLYLPYIGIHALKADDVMGKTITVTYHVDILSGACIAYVKCGSSVLYSFIGQCASSIPITGNDWTNVINGVLNVAGNIGTMVATGGASAPFALGAIASTAVNSMKPQVEKSGSMSGTAGMMGIQTPYLIITRPRQALPERQNHFTGYPSYITQFLGELKGYTEIESIHLEKIPCTETELSEIEQLLKTGVIL